ncbi:restriction endonuclease subunit S [Clostridium perfringens]
MNFIKVKELFEIKKGKKVEQIEAFKEGCIRYIQIDDLRNNNNIKFCNEEKSYIISNSDDIIIAWDGANAGTIGYGLVGAIGSTLAILRKKDNNFNTEYCGLFLKSKFNYLRDKCTGATIPHISRSSLEELRVPNIGVEEQKKIANILNLAQELIDKRKKQIEELDLLVKSKFIEMFGNPVNNDMKWDKVVCNDITSKIGSGATPKGGNSSYKEQGISLIRSMNVHNNTFLVKDLAFIDDKQAEKLKNVIVKEDDILLNITGASVARCCKVPKDIIPARVNQHVAILRCDNEKINPSFMEYQFTNESYQRLLWDIATSGGATREAITKQQIQMLEVILPPIELQNQFAEFVNQVYKLKFKMEFDLKELEYNFNSLMKKYFQN